MAAQGTLAPPPGRPVGRAEPSASAALTTASGVRHGLLRELSEQAVLEVVFREGPITRPEIAERTGLSKPTVSQAVARLERDGLVHKDGERRGSPGRVATLYSVNRQAGFVVGVDVGGTRVRAATANLYGEILSEAERSTDGRGGKHVLLQIQRLARTVARSRGIDWRLVASVSVATPGVVDPLSRQVHLAYNIPSWDGIDLIDELTNGFGTPVMVENNVNLAAVGEKWRGLARDVSTFAYVAVGAGVGMGLVLNNELFSGARGAAGEIAYLPLAQEPLDPSHRNHGPLEDEAGGSAIVAAARSNSQWNRAPAATVQEVFELAGTGYRPAQRVVAEEARRLSFAIASVCAMIDPELVVLGGGIGSSPLLLEPVRQTVASLIPFVPPIESSLLGDRAALYGAVAVALRTARNDLLWGGRTA